MMQPKSSGKNKTGASGNAALPYGRRGTTGNRWRPVGILDQLAVTFDDFEHERCQLGRVR
jgi:hypothetical protein